MTIWVDKIPSNYILIMRGCAGLGAIIFVVIVGILSYRVNKPHISNRKKMNTSFYIWMGVLGVIAGLNLIMSKKQKDSKPRTIGILFNEFALGCIVIEIYHAVNSENQRKVFSLICA